eukprot:m.19797 g.19797  ORF g.19797 m.19797 type:complete len:195 (-) comp5174_c1_seq1:76-660(-)
MGKVKFQVHLEVEGLYAVPYQTAIVFCKIKPFCGKFTNGKTFFTHRLPVDNNAVIWKEVFDFSVKMKTGDNAIALPYIVKISVRREIQGGSKHMKLGHALVDLSEFVGGERGEKTYLLVSDDESHRHDNSTLKVGVTMKILEGNPVVKPRTVHDSGRQSHIEVDDDEEEDDEGLDPPGVSSDDAARIVQQVLDE